MNEIMRTKALKHLQQQPLCLPSKPIISLFFHLFIAPISSSSSEASSKITLTQQELSKINLFLPRLCLSNQISTAIHLTATALLTNPPPNSLSLSILIDSLTSQPDMALPMSLLTRLKHSPVAHPSLTPINAMLIASYLKKHKPKEAMKVFNWMVRPGSPCVPDEKVCGVLVNGFCRKGMVLEALKVLRVMVDADLVPRRELGMWVYRGLLREARIREAMELKEAFACVGDDGVTKVLALLDHLIANWTE